MPTGTRMVAVGGLIGALFGPACDVGAQGVTPPDAIVDAAPSASEAPSPTDPDGSARWRLQFEPIAWAPALNGDLALRGGNGFDMDIVDMTEVSWSPAWQVSLRDERWTFTFDGFQFDTDGDARSSGPFEGGGIAVVRGDEVSYDVEYAAYTLTAGYRVWSMPVRNVFDGIELGAAKSPFETPANGVGVFLDLLAGARVYDLSLSMESAGGTIADEDEQWTDAIIGARLTIDLPSGFGLDVTSDIGALGSDFAWNIEVGLQYAITDNVAAELGFRHLSTNYETGGSDPFEWDVSLAGIYGSLVIRF